MSGLRSGRGRGSSSARGSRARCASATSRCGRSRGWDVGRQVGYPVVAGSCWPSGHWAMSRDSARSRTKCELIAASGALAPGQGAVAGKGPGSAVTLPHPCRRASPPEVAAGVGDARRPGRHRAAAGGAGRGHRIRPQCRLPPRSGGPWPCYVLQAQAGMTAQGEAAEPHVPAYGGLGRLLPMCPSSRAGTAATTVGTMRRRKRHAC
jgi:hypothetical protein